MALIMGITLPAGWDIIYNKTLKMYDISVMCNVGKNPIWFPRKKKLQLREITYLFNIAYAWGALTAEEKEEWNYASNIIGQHNYNLYVQDKSYRIKNGIAGNATPSIYHQYLVGHIKVEAPDTTAKIVQYNGRRVYFPAKVGISAKTSLTALDTDAYAKVRMIWNNYKSGQTIERVTEINLPLEAGWDMYNQRIQEYSGQKGRWRIELELFNVLGDIWFDNPYVIYNGAINLNDPYCLDVVKWWKAEDIGENVTFETMYPTGEAI